MINDVEKKKRKIRWWFNISSSILIVLLGLTFLAIRYLWDLNPLGGRFWMVTGLLLGYGAFRSALYAWKGGHLYDDMED